MFESKNMNAVGKSAIVNRERKARHEVASYVFVDNPPTLGSDQDHRNCAVCLVKKLHTQLCNTAFVILRGLD